MNTLTEASHSIADWFWVNRPGLPDDVRAALEPFMALNRSPVDAVGRTVEAIYAARDRLPKEALKLGGELALFASAHGFYELDRDGRGEKISLVLRRASGERARPGHPWPKEEPTPRPQFLPEPKKED
jgi:hypothetical protein